MNSQDFVTFLKQLGLKDSTIRKHLYSIKPLKESFTLKEIQAKIGSMREAGYKNSYINTTICAVRRYAQFLISNDVDCDPELLTLPLLTKSSKSIRTTMTDQEIEAFLNLTPLSKRGAGHVSFSRWTLFFKIMAYTGMRCGEVANLGFDDVDLSQKLILIRDSKTNTPRVIPLPKSLENDLTEYLSQIKYDKLFKAKNRTGAFNSVQWDYQFKTRVKRLGIFRPGLSCYSLRHSFITNRISDNVNIYNLQAIVGHSDVRMTQRYTHLSVEQLRGVVDGKNQSLDSRLSSLETTMNKILVLLERG